MNIYKSQTSFPVSPRSLHNLPQLPSVLPVINSQKPLLTVQQSPKINGDEVKQSNFGYFMYTPINKGLGQPQSAKEGSFSEKLQLLKEKDVKSRLVKRYEKTISLPSLEKTPKSLQDDVIQRLKTKTIKIGSYNTILDSECYGSDPSNDVPLRKSTTKNHIQDLMGNLIIEEENCPTMYAKMRYQQKFQGKKQNHKTFGECNMSRIHEKRDSLETEGSVMGKMKKRNKKLRQFFADLEVSIIFPLNA